MATCICGSDQRKVYVYKDQTMGREYRVECRLFCGCGTSNPTSETRDEAIALWNDYIDRKKEDKWKDWHDTPYPYKGVIT